MTTEWKDSNSRFKKYNYVPGVASFQMFVQLAGIQTNFVYSTCLNLGIAPVCINETNGERRLAVISINIVVILT